MCSSVTTGVDTFKPCLKLVVEIRKGAKETAQEEIALNESYSAFYLTLGLRTVRVTKSEYKTEMPEELLELGIPFGIRRFSALLRTTRSILS